jgi:hypothetical protein
MNTNITVPEFKIHKFSSNFDRMLYQEKCNVSVLFGTLFYDAFSVSRLHSVDDRMTSDDDDVDFYCSLF